MGATREVGVFVRERAVRWIPSRRAGYAPAAHWRKSRTSNAVLLHRQRRRRALAQIADQLVDALGIAVPREHEARRSADEGVEAPSARAQLVEDLLAGLNKHRVRLDGLRQPHAGNPGDLRSELPRAAVGVRGVAQPRAALNMPTHGAERKRIFDASCPACLQR